MGIGTVSLQGFLTVGLPGISGSGVTDAQATTPGTTITFTVTSPYGGGVTEGAEVVLGSDGHPATGTTEYWMERSEDGVNWEPVTPTGGPFVAAAWARFRWSIGPGTVTSLSLASTVA